MKYENFQKIKTIVESIDDYSNKLSRLKSDNVIVKLYNESTENTITTIGTWSASEHPYRDEAKNFVDTLIAIHRDKIDELHAQLAEL